MKNRMFQSKDDKNKALLVASRNGLIDKVKYLIRHRTHANADISFGKNAPIHEAACYGHLEIVKYLHKHKADLKSLGVEGYTPMYLAARRGHLKVIQYLESVGINVHAREKNGLTPFEAGAEHLNVLKYFIEKGLSKEIINKVFFKLCCTPNADLLPNILYLIPFADLEAKDNRGYTPVWCAAAAGCFSAVELLINHGAYFSLSEENEHDCFNMILKALQYNLIYPIELYPLFNIIFRLNPDKGCKLVHSNPTVLHGFNNYLFVLQQKIAIEISMNKILIKHKFLVSETEMELKQMLKKTQEYLLGTSAHSPTFQLHKPLQLCFDSLLNLSDSSILNKLKESDRIELIMAFSKHLNLTKEEMKYSNNILLPCQSNELDKRIKRIDGLLHELSILVYKKNNEPEINSSFSFSSSN